MMPAAGRRTAIYVRVSTTKESQKDSPEHQEANCREKARQLDLDILEGFVYEDRDTGTNIISRPAIQQLLQDAKRRAFDVVIFAALSRFSRDALDSLSLKKKLVDMLGIRLISLEEGFDSLHNHDELKFQIISAVNQTLSQQISFSSRRGIRQSALKGNFTGSIAPYGYRKAVIGERKSLVPDEETRSVIELIFKLYTADQLGEKEIVKRLNEQLRIPSPKGGLWGISSVQRILQNEAYTGRNVFNKYETTLVYHDEDDLTNRSKKLIQREKHKWERAHEPNTHEAIIDDHLFDLAQKIRAQRSGGKQGGARHKKNVFAGFIHCAHCGSSMVSMKSQGRHADQEYRYLICSKRRRQGDLGCLNSFHLPYLPFKEDVLTALSEQLRAAGSSESFYDRYKDSIMPDTSAADRQEQSLLKQIERSRSLLLALRKERAQGTIDERQYEYERASCEQELSHYERRLRELHQETDRQMDRERLMAYIQGAIGKLLALEFEEGEFEALRLTLKRLIARITVSRDGTVHIRTAFA
ncbi:DNA invertase Pin-like site-specific DNA recombinase [Paenibacillus phyllosphaerae]|uniref:DNA invertase Pin-like site-specific DNA recombinase n=1 Tax=Paenibacillus phyllosphaerae TaxID=274593 RepID=A0A7W5FQM1_9BACL|nr:recombinase family protein [Paenibacillus phyllosphaerae]MBB3113605.1 DNA invertase Pin-like site-specific DNA recombinase [Paenibacillus phyllosphaerae]